MIPAALDEAALDGLRARAARYAGPFTDPAMLRRARVILPGTDPGWLEQLTGHPVRSWTRLTSEEIALAVLAAEAAAGRPGSLRAGSAAASRAAGRDREAREAAAHQAARDARDAWEALRARLPVPAQVRHNWTARHLDGYEQGADHIVVLADLTAGRLCRKTGQPLCWTPSRGRELSHVSVNTGDEERLPSCKACLRHAENLAR